MIFGAILAGGVGSRMNIADMPKQFLPLGDKPIIIYRLMTVLYVYLIPIIPDVLVFFRAILRMLYPYIIY